MRAQDFVNESISGTDMLDIFNQQHHEISSNRSMNQYIRSQDWGIKMIDPHRLQDPLTTETDPFNRVIDIDPDQVQHFVELMKDNQPIKPIIIGPNGSVLDGNHRTVAARLLDRKLQAYVPMI